MGVLPVTARSMENTKGTNCGVQARDELEVLGQNYTLHDSHPHILIRAGMEVAKQRPKISLLHKIK